MKIFISHCSEDGKVIEKLVSIWKACGTDITLFYSSNPETGVAAGDGLLNRINGEIEQCDYFVPIITENYVRSLYCIYELSVAMYLQNSWEIFFLLQTFCISTRKVLEKPHCFLSLFPG